MSAKRKFQILTIQDVPEYKGNDATKLPTKRELVGYVPQEKRIAALLAAGLRTAAYRDLEFYDIVDDEISSVEPPLLPRHIPSDLAEVSEIAREYRKKRMEIEERVRQAIERDKAGKEEPAPEQPVQTPAAQ